MAKQQKGGLGRGLSSLISGSYEETAQAQAAGQAAVQSRPVATPATRAASSSVERELVETPEELKELQEALLEKKREREEHIQENRAEASTATEPVQQAAPAIEAPSPAVSAPIPVISPSSTGSFSTIANGQRRSVPPEKKERTERLSSNDEVKIAEENVTIMGVATREAPAVATAPKREQVEETVEPEINKIQANPIDQRFESARPADEVPIDSIVPNPNQPRTNFKAAELDELAGSIERDGLLQPILVREMGEGSYQIIAGERRWQACKQLGLKTVPIRVKEATDNEALELALVENIQRSDLNPIEEAWGYRRLMEKKGLTQTQLAQTLSKGRSTIANTLRLLDLPEDAQQLLFEEKITAGHARAILSVPTTEGRQKLAEKLVSEKLSVRETENIARLMSAQKKPRTAQKEAAPASYTLAARALKAALETNVKVKSAQGKNKIEIEFQDEKDLQRIVKRFVEE